MSTFPAAQTLRRRGFLIGAASASLAAASCARPDDPNAAAWKELAKALTVGTVDRPGTAAPYNLAYPTPLPAGVARCMNTKDVQAAIQWCVKYGIQPTPRSGGHSYAGYSMGAGLVIDTLGIGGSRYDPGSGRVWVSGGALNQDIYKLLRQQRRAITHGRCGPVGASGFLLGGGIGFNMRASGVAVDQLEETEIVLANGEAVTAHANNAYRDLFRACRGGGGGNFGVNTGFWLSTFAVDEVVMFKIQWGFANGKQLEVARALMDTFTDAPNGLGSRLSLHAQSPKDNVAVDLIGQFRGPMSQLMALLEPALRADRQPIKYDIRTMEYWAAQDELEDHDLPTRFHERSAFLPGKLDTAALTTAGRYLNAWPGTAGGQADLRFFQTGGAMNNDRDDTAFVHRRTKWLMDVGLSWGPRDSLQTVDENVAWQNAFYSAMLPYSTGGAYQNFIDPAEYNWEAAYYGRYAGTLREVKTKYDGKNLFHFPQSIRPA